eukprot:1138899-Pelagomonas_calceolata.AAC.1
MMFIWSPKLGPDLRQITVLRLDVKPTMFLAKPHPKGAKHKVSGGNAVLLSGGSYGQSVLKLLCLVAKQKMASMAHPAHPPP